MTVEQLNERLRWLVLERETLHEFAAAADELELEIVRAQWHLSYAVVELHQPPELDQAA